jgi:type III pantothenate kinase
MRNKIIVLDIGNTNIVTGVYDENRLISSWRIHTDKYRTEDEYFVVISSLLKSIKEDTDNIATAVLSSVVPQLNRIIRRMFDKYFNCHFIDVNASTELGLTYLTPDPSFIGADLVVNAYASIKKYQTNTIVCDLGTATTVQLTGKDGTFYGASIIPGVKSSSNSLFEKASLLADIKLSQPQGILGINTKDALLSGIINGHAFILDGFIRRIKEEYNLTDYKTIATGGVANLICSCSKEVDLVDESLILDGLHLIAKK